MPQEFSSVAGRDARPKDHSTYRGAAWIFARLFLVLPIVLIGCFEQDASIEEAARFIRTGDREAGLEMMRELLEEEPNNPRFLYLYGRALANGGQTGAAQWPLRRAMKDPDWLLKAGLLAAQGAYKTGSYETAIEIASEILEVHPDDVSLLLLRTEAGIDARLGYERPLEDAEHILDIEPAHPQALRLRLVALLNLERVDEASELLDELAKSMNEHEDEAAAADLCAIRSTFTYEKGETEEAIESWNTCVERFPAYARVLSPALGFFDELGEVNRSIEILEKAVEAESENISFLWALAIRLSNVGRADEGEALLKRAAEFDNPLVGWRLLSDYYLMLNNRLGRAEALDQVVELMPKATNPNLLFDRADAWLLAGDLERVEELAAELSVPAHRTLLQGRVALERGEAQRALDLFEETSKLWPNQTFARYYAGFAAELLGDFDRAIEEYRHAIRSGADKTDARYRLAQLYFAEEENRAALETLSVAGGDQTIRARGLVLRILAREGRIEAIRNQMIDYWPIPGVRAELFEQVLLGFADRGGPGEAARTIEGIPIDLRDPRDARLLRRYVVLQLQAGNAAEAAKRAEDAVRASPDNAVFNEIVGTILESSGRDPSRARAYYERAIALDQNHGRAMLGLARLKLSEKSEPIVARELVGRAIEAAGNDRDDLLACARVLISMQEPERAEQVLTDLWRDEPTDSRATEPLAKLRFERGLSDDRTLMLGRSALRFGGDRRSAMLLASIHDARGETKPATAIRNQLRQRDVQE
jgi:tetratricopeptide (TPR) repeat protein